jgi:hypothetical protein
MNKSLLLAGLTIFAASAAHAAAPSGVTLTGQYVAMCQNKTSVSDQNFCHGFGQGVYDSYVMSRHPKKAPHYVCPPSPGPKRDAAIDAFVVWANQNTQYADQSAADSIMRYLATTYPCKTSKASKTRG